MHGSVEGSQFYWRSGLSELAETLAASQCLCTMLPPAHAPPPHGLAFLHCLEEICLVALVCIHYPLAHAGSAAR